MSKLLVYVYILIYMTSTNYLKTFFAEKGLNDRLYEVEAPNGDVHFITTDIVIEHIFAASSDEQTKIAAIIRKIDFHNGDVHHFLTHLATALAANHAEQSA